MKLTTKKSVREMSDALMKRWKDMDVMYTLGIDHQVQEVEAYIHDLAHAAVFDIDPFKTNDLSDDVAAEFSRFEKPESDRKEIEGIVVSFLVFDRTGLKVSDRARRKIVTNAVGNFEEKWWTPAIVWKLIDFLLSKQDMKVETERVIGWMEWVLKEHREK